MSSQLLDLQQFYFHDFDSVSITRIFVFSCLFHSIVVPLSLYDDLIDLDAPFWFNLAMDVFCSLESRVLWVWAAIFKIDQLVFDQLVLLVR